MQNKQATLKQNKQTTLKLISTHRLDPEKGWDLILGWLKKVLGDSGLLRSIRNDNRDNTRSWKLHYDIYGDGLLRSEVEELARLYPDQIIYHGYVSLSKVFEHSTNYDFVMMPSHFVETFGLSALDFAQFGIPTIGFQKGGLRQFVSDELDIYQSSGDTLQEKMNNLMDKLVYECIHNDLAKYSIDRNTIKDKYGFPIWLEKFKMLIK